MCVPESNLPFGNSRRRTVLTQNALTPQESSDANSQQRGWLTRQAPSAWLLPLSGLWIMGLDWILFSSNAVSLGLATPISVGLGFTVGSIGTLIFQRRLARDPWWKAIPKAVVAGVLVGVPWPIGGTIAGGWILVASGLNQITRKQDG